MYSLGVCYLGVALGIVDWIRSFVRSISDTFLKGSTRPSKREP